MKELAYEQWLERQPLQPKTIETQMYRARRVDQYCGDLDNHYASDRMASLVQLLTYSMDDEHHNRPNPTSIPIQGHIRTNLASYLNATRRYRTFREAAGEAIDSATIQAPQGGAVADEEMGQRIGLERDMQKALRIQIEQLEAGLTITDEGAERAVESGFIDITARDASGTTVVIELKAGPAGQRAVAQILSYMGDVATEEDGRVPRGILVASTFDAKAKAAAKVIPHFLLKRYSVRFIFQDGHAE